MREEQKSHFYEFGSFSLDAEERRLFRDGEPVHLTQKALDTLLVLVRRSGHVVEKDQLLSEVWKDAFVEEAIVAQNIFALRQALGRDPDGRAYIETVPRRGYRFVASVRDVLRDDSALVVQQETWARIVVEEKSDDEKGDDPSGNKPRGLAALYSRLKPGPARGRTLLVIFSLLLVAPGVWYLREARKTDSDFKAKSLAVLPFNTLGPNSGDDYLRLGMADAVINRLSHLKELSVLPTSSVFRFTGKDRDAREVGRQLGVDAVLDGTVQRAGERVRVTAQLVRVGNGQLLWTGSFDGRFDDIFSLQDAISEQMSDALALQISGDERKLLTKRPTSDPDAYQAYLVGLYFWNKRTKDGLNKAVEYFQQAIDRDPNYAAAYAGLADSYFLISYYEFDADTRVYEMKGKPAALKAVELDPNLAQAQLAMAMSQWQDRDLAGTQRAFERALALNPNDATTHLRYAWFYLRCKDQLEDGVAELRRAQELDPLSPAAASSLSTAFMYTRQYDEAVRMSQKAVELNPDFDLFHVSLGMAYELDKKYSEALGEYEKAQQLGPHKEYTLGYLGHTYAVMGRKADAASVVTKLRTLAKDNPRDSLYGIALIYSALNEEDRAMQWLDKAVAAGSSSVDVLRYDPQLDVLRSDQRFADLIRQAQNAREHF